jgi:hypothetical protein
MGWDETLRKVRARKAVVVVAGKLLLLLLLRRSEVGVREFVVVVWRIAAVEPWDAVAAGEICWCCCYW